jgi:hypothetical protein
MAKVTWSYSSLKTFQQCPKKYYHLKIAKDIQQEDTVHTIYGKEVHKAAEDYIKEGKPVPEKYSYVLDTLDALNKIPGEKYCEIELGIKKTSDGKYVACEFKDPKYWWHGIADLVIIDGGLAYLADYKTSKNAKYADTKQLDLLAAGVFLHFPQVIEIKSALAFVVSGEFVKKEHHSFYKTKYLETMKPELDRLEAALSNKVWNPVSGPLCGFCPVNTCVHQRKRK